MIIRQQLDDFYHFALQQMAEQPSELSLDELYLAWRAQHPAPNELQQSVEAVRAAHAGYKQGDQGAPAREHLRKVCTELGLVIDE